MILRKFPVKVTNGLCKTISSISPILCQDFSNARLLSLNRSKVLNAYNQDMLGLLECFLKSHRHSNSNAINIMYSGFQKAFCVGNDVVELTHHTSASDVVKFLYNEYQFCHYLATTPSLNLVTLWNGYVLGGGVGVSIGSSFRVVSEKTILAMPEAAIGLSPDVGASWFLPRVRIPSVGLYMALTGARISGADLCHLGLATSFIHSHDFVPLKDALCSYEEVSNPFEAIYNAISKFSLWQMTLNDIRASSNSEGKGSFSEFSAEGLPPFTLQPHLNLIEDVFNSGQQDLSLLGIKSKLENTNDPFGKSILEKIISSSPSGLQTALESFRRGSAAKERLFAHAQEFNTSVIAFLKGDFKEGVRALLVDKTKDPHWNPPSIEEIDLTSVESLFSIPGLPSFHATDPFPENLPLFS